MKLNSSIKIGHPSFQMDDIFGKTVNQAALTLREAKICDSGIAYTPEMEKYL